MKPIDFTAASLATLFPEIPGTAAKLLLLWHKHLLFARRKRLSFGYPSSQGQYRTIVPASLSRPFAHFFSLENGNTRRIPPFSKL